MPHRIDHPHRRDVHAEYGWDHAIGFFVTVFEEDRVLASYDALHAGYTHLDGAGRFLARQGFFSIETYERALERLPVALPEEMPKRFRAAAEVVNNFKRDAD